ncbi:MAG: hypothetical protein IJA99_04355 [Oscillospiraceae bacterium]|nr:hypothetical protein [Oscillospiraceae bacterium]
MGKKILKILLVLLAVVLVGITAFIVIIELDIYRPVSASKLEQQIAEAIKDNGLFVPGQNTTYGEQINNETGERNTVWVETYAGDFIRKTVELDGCLIDDHYREDGSLFNRTYMYGNGRVIEESYDSNNVLRVRNELFEGSIVTSSYDAAGIIYEKFEQSDDGDIITSRYDTAGVLREKQKVGMDAKIVTTYYDENGKKTHTEKVG